MTIPVVVGSLAGQIPVIAIAGITVKYKEAMLGGKKAKGGRKVKYPSKNRPF